MKKSKKIVKNLDLKLMAVGAVILFCVWPLVGISVVASQVAFLSGIGCFGVGFIKFAIG